MAHWIAGTSVAGAGPNFSSLNPADQSVVWSGREATSAELAFAVRVAREAFASWADQDLPARMVVLEAFRDLLKQESEHLARIIAREIGKPLWEARAELASMVAKVDISMAAYRERSGERSAPMAEGVSQLRHRPHGVLAVFGPHNFPGHLPNGHIVPALLAGNTVVFKPSEHAPLTGLEMAKLWQRAGLPDGVLNVVNGGRETGVALAALPDLAGILFTGSYRAGVALHRQFAGRPEKLLALEMGGNNPLVVWPTTAIDAAIHHTLFSAFVSAGQRCTCARRLIVPDDAWGEHFLGRLVAAAGKLRVGAWDDDPPAFLGPVVSAAAARQVVEAQDQLFARGARALLALRVLPRGAAFLSPGIVEVTGLGDLPDEEVFGPLLQVHRAPDFTAALRIANDTSYGLAAGLLADAPELWERFTREVRAGVVNWNRPTTGAASSAPFGGVGRSGNLRPSAYYAADYCAYPVASLIASQPALPAQLPPGLSL